MRRRTLTLSGSFVAVAGLLLFLVGPGAAAQTVGYPPGTCATTNGTQDAGNHAVGDTFTVTLSPVCLFAPGSSVAIVVNGISVTSKTADNSGFVSVTIKVNSQSELLIEDPVSVGGQCGANRVVATGPSAVAGARVDQTATFGILCAATAAPKATAGVAFTGANILRWTAIAVALVLLGSLLIVADRRRRSRS